MTRSLLLVPIAFLFALPAVAESPTVTDSRLTLELVAEQPEIVTPTGVAIDKQGRIWVIENQTHQRTPQYKGPPSDRIRVFEDFDATGRARKITTFVEGFKDSMGLSFGPDGALYLATRAAIFRFTKPLANSNRTRIISLQTKGDYPHNGLCGFAWDTNGDMIFGLGENLGADYKIVGSDDSTLGGGGEGGSVYRARPDGSKIERIATGFWNPFAQTVDAAGRLFVVDNDPDARGPCRLLHVVQGGDFGYRFRYGRKGTHPFQSWNGELPGTLPMVAGTSEAPSGVLPADFTSLPFPGELLITSWGDHTIERFTLSPRGASFSAVSKTIVRGGENFRPVAIAAAPDGSVVFTDWVDKSYPVHGKGGIWRLRAKPEFSGKPKAPASASAPKQHSEAEWFAIAKNDPSPHARMQAILQIRSPQYVKEFVPLLADADPFLASAALEVLGRPGQSALLKDAASATPQAAVGVLLALRRTGDTEARKSLVGFLANGDPSVRRAAIQWVAEEKIVEFAVKLDNAASAPPVTRELFEAWLAARQLLAGKKDAPSDELLVGILKDAKQPVLFRTLALRSLRPDQPLLTPALLAALLKEPDEALKREVVRTLLVRPDSAAQGMLRQIAEDDSMPVALRALAVAGLAQSAESGPTRATLSRLQNHAELSAVAARSLTEKLPPQPKRGLEEWRQLLATEGSAAAGERVFFHPKGPGCYKCHQIDNRGAAIGPDLTFIGKAAPRDKIIESILEPSKEIAPSYTSWRISTRDGKERVGIIVGETFDSFVLIADSEGKIAKVPRTDIEERVALPKSIMPDELPSLMTPQEFRDLLAFLVERK